MLEQKIHRLLPHACENDRIACNLLKGIARYEQFAILYSIDTMALSRILDVALLQEEYEICQVICELVEERKILDIR
jgi:hypothetical protein